MPKQELITELTEQHWKLILYLVAGHNQKDAAEYFHLHPNTISRLYHDPMFKSALIGIRGARNDEFIKEDAKVQKHVNSYRLQAAEVYTDLLENADSESVRRDIAKDILSFGRVERGGKTSVEVEGEKQISITISDPHVEDDKLISLEVEQELLELNKQPEEIDNDVDMS